MEDVLLLDAAERYLKGSMNQQEKLFFEELRKNNPELDQMVVEQTFFLNEVEKYGDLKSFKHSLHEVDTKLAEEGIIRKSDLHLTGKIVYIWKKYKRTVTVAASIAGIVSTYCGFSFCL
jgi:hypothetical protein